VKCLVGVVFTSIAYDWFLSGIEHEMEQRSKMLAMSLSWSPIKIVTYYVLILVNDQNENIQYIEQSHGEKSWFTTHSKYFDCMKTLEVLVHLIKSLLQKCQLALNALVFLVL